VAASLKQPLSLTSEYLRALEARGLLTVRRVGKRVKYSSADAVKRQSANPLSAALRKTFLREEKPVDTAFKLATAFTHPRRIEIVRLLQIAPRTTAQIQTVTGISARSLSRHLRKLEQRGFIVRCLGGFAVANRTDPFGQELVRLTMK
jgi:DNA-binding transcriptional ArsR family regulator